MGNSDIEGSDFERALRQLQPRLTAEGRKDVLNLLAHFRGFSSSVDEEGSLSFDDELKVALFLGKLWIEFVDSTHGDGCAVSIYLLPMGTAIADLFSTSEDEPDGFVLVDWTQEELIRRASALLLSCQGGADWAGLGEWDDEQWVSEDFDTVRRGGMEALRQSLFNAQSDGLAHLAREID